MLKPPEILQHLCACMPRICDTRPQIRAVYLFGSNATGTAGPDSDVDIAVLVDDGCQVNELVSLRLDLLTELTRAGFDRIDLVMLNHAPDLLRFEAVRQNQPLYLRDDFDHGTYYSYVLRTFEDFRPRLAIFRAAAKKDMLANG